jgi:general secretion pathway protein B
MSLILDALKKLDREKKSRRGGDLDIAAEMLSGDFEGPDEKKALLISGLLVTFALAGITLYWAIYMSGRQPVIVSPAPAPQITAQSNPAPSGALPEKTRGVQAVPAGETESARPKTAAPGLPESRQASAARPIPPAKKDVEDPRGGKPEPAGVSVKISLIIWDEHPANRSALVNGTLVREGEQVEDMKVEEIFPTRIKFSRKGRSFEASIN